MATSGPPKSRKPRWRRWLFLAITTTATTILTLAGLVLALILLSQQSWFQSQFFSLLISFQTVDHPTEPPATPGVEYDRPIPSAEALQSAGQLFVATNVWSVHLTFTSNEWKELGPIRIPRTQNWIGEDGAPTVRNPAAVRPGVTGVAGFDLPWSSGNFELGGVIFTNAAVRFKGNGTLLSGLANYKRPFKVDVGKRVPGRTFAGQTTFNLHNLSADRSFLSDTLAYEFYRDAGVPAPRTAYARVFLTLTGRWEKRLLGLYLLVENPDRDWARERFGRGAALFKPVTLHLFDDLGKLWEPYEEIYEPRGKVAPAQRQRLLALARLVTHASDADFAAQLGDLVDLDAFARFMACEALLANYDGILNTGQNFLLWLDPRTEKFGFGPWDLDHSWGEFPWAGTAEDRERSNVFHPWLGRHRFFERVFALEDFQKRYRRALDRLLEELFVPARLHQRIDQLAAAIRPAVAQQSTNQLALFEQAVSEAPPSGPRDGSPFDDARRPVHPLKHFITVRAAEVRAQLEGKSEGVVLKRGR